MHGKPWHAVDDAQADLVAPLDNWETNAAAASATLWP